MTQLPPPSVLCARSVRCAIFTGSLGAVSLLHLVSGLPLLSRLTVQFAPPVHRNSELDKQEAAAPREHNRAGVVFGRRVAGAMSMFKAAPVRDRNADFPFDYMSPRQRRRFDAQVAANNQPYRVGMKDPPPPGPPLPLPPITICRYACGACVLPSPQSSHPWQGNSIVMAASNALAVVFFDSIWYRHIARLLGMTSTSGACDGSWRDVNRSRRAVLGWWTRHRGGCGPLVGEPECSTCVCSIVSQWVGGGAGVCARVSVQDSMQLMHNIVYCALNVTPPRF